ncbi:Capsular glucan synthase [Maioricimonas rarisocia]|uniref:Capsular glucan synthase n=1 Tax=Maioricimonas rarisocia TaxID=2528026 RepID=A0A517Z0J5_9PLAN|nr:glycosyltransferase family 4 protein [Maioricimonas rarisocia]QDU35929.1 Capsular glucan synthase [Maioricimonas rarisocia]
MHIAILCEFATCNGGEQSLLAVLRHLKDRCEFTLLAPEQGPFPDAVRREGIRLVPWSVRDAGGKRLERDTLVERLAATVRDVSPDLVHANSLAMGRLLGAAADRLDVLGTAHIRDIIGLNKAAIADLNRNQALVCVSEATRQFHVARGLDPTRAVTIYNGIDTDLFHPRKPTGSLRREIGISRNALLTATIGQIGLRKGLHVLPFAAEIVDRKGIDVRYLLVGERHSQKQESIEYEEELFEQFEYGGVIEQMHPLGWRDDVPELLGEIDVLIHPAFQEPLGRVLLEAAATGTAIIATEVGGTPEIFTHGESALLVTPGDHGELADAIEDVARDKKYRRKLGQAARQEILDRFRIEPRADELARFWEDNLP